MLVLGVTLCSECVYVVMNVCTPSQWHHMSYSLTTDIQQSSRTVLSLELPDTQDSQGFSRLFKTELYAIRYVQQTIFKRAFYIGAASTENFRVTFCT